MVKLLLDANQSPLTRVFLTQVLGMDVIDLISEGKSGLSDEEVVALARREKRTVVTFDLDFGELYHFREKGTFGVLILRLEDQTVESVTKRLERFFTKEANNLNLNNKLVVLEERRIRIG